MDFSMDRGLLGNIGLALFGSPRIERTAKEYQGLLNKEYVPGDPSALPLGNNPTELDQSILQQQGGFRQPGGLLGASPSSDFYLKAATIPGLTQPMLTQAQQQQAAMDRQVQEQTYRQSNMSAAEFANHTLQTEKLRADQEWQQYQFGNLSAAQKGQLGIAQQQADMQRQQYQLPTPLNFTNETAVRTAYGNTQNAMNVLTDYERILSSGEAPGFFTAGTAKGKQFQQTFEAAMVPIVTKMFKPSGDAPSESELKMIKDYIGDMTALGTDAGKLQKLRQLKQDVQQYWSPYQQYGAMPSAQAGKSAFALSYMPKAVPRPEGLTPFTPGGK